MLTLLDIAKMTGSDAVAGLIDETSQTHPEVSGRTMQGGQLITVPRVGAARTISGRMYKTLVRTGLPTVGFRSANEGVSTSKATYENRIVETYIFNPRWEADKAVADSHEDGPEAVIALEAAAQMEAGMQHLGTQFYYGKDNASGDSKGHPGLLGMYDATNMEVDAAGTTDDVASSVWAVRFGPQHVQWVYGQNGSLNPSDLRTETLTDSNGDPFTGYVQEILAYPGLQVGSKRSVARIKKLTTDSGKGLTDALLYSLLRKFPAGTRPDVIFLSRRSLEQLRASRTATNATGTPAPTPTDIEGIPLVPTDSILDTEKLAW